MIVFLNGNNKVVYLLFFLFFLSSCGRMIVNSYTGYSDVEVYQFKKSSKNDVAKAIKCFYLENPDNKQNLDLEVLSENPYLKEGGSDSTQFYFKLKFDNEITITYYLRFVDFEKNRDNSIDNITSMRVLGFWKNASFWERGSYVNADIEQEIKSYTKKFEKEILPKIRKNLKKGCSETVIKS